jgi:amidohydrolase
MLPEINALFEKVLRWRRRLHRHPELSFQEERTLAFVSRLLRNFGLDLRPLTSGYGVIAELAGGSPGPTLALRAELDALPIQDEKRCEYRSQVHGVMHACAHDAHTATLLGAACLLARHRESLRGRVRFLFQPAEEEPPGGAPLMIREGALAGVDEIFALHYAPFALGQVSVTPGLAFGMIDRFTIRLRGGGGHAAHPHLGADAILATGQLIVALQSIISRDLDPLHPAVLTIGQVTAGQTYNALASTAELTGTIRCLHQTDRERIRSRLVGLTEGIAQLFGLTAAVSYEEGYPPVVNHPAATRYAAGVIQQVLGPGALGRLAPMLSSDDFAYYLQERPGCYLMVGSAGPDPSTHYPLHHPLFDVDERAMAVGLRLLVGLVLGRLAPELLPTLEGKGRPDAGPRDAAPPE